MPPARTEPERRSHSRRQKPGHVPRPKNAFMCYRSWFYENKSLPPTPDGKKLNQQVLSKQVAITWNSMSPEEQAPFHEMAKQEKKAHELKHPLYSYSPGKLQSKPANSKRKRSVRPRRRLDNVSEDDQSTCDDEHETPPPVEGSRRVRRASDASCISGTSDTPYTALSPLLPPSPTPSLCASSSSEPDLSESDEQDSATQGGKYYIDQSLVVLPDEKELGPFLASYDIERPSHMNDGLDMFGAMHGDWSVDEELFSPNFHDGIAPCDTVYFNGEAPSSFFQDDEATWGLWMSEVAPQIEESPEAQHDPLGEAANQVNQAPVLLAWTPTLIIRDPEPYSSPPTSKNKNQPVELERRASNHLKSSSPSLLPTCHPPIPRGAVLEPDAQLRERQHLVI